MSDGEGKHQLWTRRNRKRLGDPSRAFLRGARWIGSAILLVPPMLCSAIVARAQPTDRAPDTIEARLRACTPCHGSQGEGTNLLTSARAVPSPLLARHGSVLTAAQAVPLLAYRWRDTAYTGNGETPRTGPCPPSIST